MLEIVGVRFKDTGKIYYFDPGENKLKPQDAVIVETARGSEYGIVAIGNKLVEEREVISPLKKFIRMATPADEKKYLENVETEKKAAEIWNKKMEERNLDMALVDVECAFDRSKLLFNFTAEGRVDFRDFVKELAGIFKTRIELRQIGVRDEAKKVGGLGICGLPICCKTFLDNFDQVSIKMAKEQNLSLNSVKISGTCGRLMCCLRYENDQYEEEGKLTPKLDSVVQTPEGTGVVVESNVLCGKIKVAMDDAPDAAPVVYHRDQVTVIGNAKKGKNRQKQVSNTNEPTAEKQPQKQNDSTAKSGENHKNKSSKHERKNHEKSSGDKQQNPQPQSNQE